LLLLLWCQAWQESGVMWKRAFDHISLCIYSLNSPLNPALESWQICEVVEDLSETWFFQAISEPLSQLFGVEWTHLGDIRWQTSKTFLVPVFNVSICPSREYYKWSFVRHYSTLLSLPRTPNWPERGALYVDDDGNWPSLVYQAGSLWDPSFSRRLWP
jgi:hypothetical protein